MGNSPNNAIDPTGLLYWDLNFTIGFWVDITVGVQVDEFGNAYPYVGPGLITPGGGLSLTVAPTSDPSPGKWSCQTQATAVPISVSAGADEDGSGFWEAGLGLGWGLGATLYYVF